MPFRGKKKPVTLVTTAVTRNSFVQDRNAPLLSIPTIATAPATIATKLIAVCIAVIAVM